MRARPAPRRWLANLAAPQSAARPTTLAATGRASWSRERAERGPHDVTSCHHPSPSSSSRPFVSASSSPPPLADMEVEAAWGGGRENPANQRLNNTHGRYRILSLALSGGLAHASSGRPSSGNASPSSRKLSAGRVYENPRGRPEALGADGVRPHRGPDDCPERGADGHAGRRRRQRGPRWQRPGDEASADRGAALWSWPCVCSRTGTRSST